ncbi:type II toxin-antitoxin system VapC family toxin [uncultured Jatrophihabitans sp.]|uniref:type II toxin-antitoxin system VapC family toxin n=1 Tax=uncultured Jatrophihabitans sp. TaxID=1610747 RepID=UPI0035CADD63
MTRPVADRAVLDTNVLLAATDEARAEHGWATAAINDWPAAGIVLYASGQILREYLAASTRPLEQNGLGMTRSDAVANVRALRARLGLLVEDAKVADRLLTLLETVECAGKQVHDANVVATMVVHGIDTVVTMNVDDFARFDDLVTVVPLWP